jgi:hypothetical protein
MQSDQLRPGSRINTHFLNRLSNQANRGAVQVSGQGISAQDTPGGMVVSLQPDAEFRENCVRMLYIGSSGLTLPPYTVVHFVTGEGSTTPGINYWPLPTCDITDQTGRIRIGILQEGAAPGGCPMVQYQGISQCFWDYTSIPSWFPGSADASNGQGHRLGTRQNSPFPQWDDNGPLVIINDIDYAALSDPMFTTALLNTLTVPASDDPIHLAMVSITGVRDADSLFCTQSSEILAPYSCFVFGPECTVAAGGQPGDVFVTG